MATAPHNIDTDPVVLFDTVLNETWQALCEVFDVVAQMPDLYEIFCDAELSKPEQAAEIVLANMIIEISANVDRFSPFYTCPARVYGLVSIRDCKTNHFRWRLASEAKRRWGSYLENLTQAIDKNSGLIQASLLIDQLALDELCDEPQITARCNCYPPKIIRLNQNILENSSIYCDVCHQNFITEPD